jgi:uncharacterized membrane protein YbhN (UPF0104 family)
LISYAVTCVAAGSVGALFAAVTAARDSDLWWGWALLVLLPIGLVSVHPAAVERVLRLVGRLGRRPLELPVPGWPAMVQLVGCSAPAWVFMGAAAAFTTHALGVTQDPVRVAFAAVAAWLVGFLAVPVPAGVGVREVVFVVLCGLPAGPATAVAAITRGLLVLVDAVGGFAALATVGRRRVRA